MNLNNKRLVNAKQNGKLRSGINEYKFNNNPILNKRFFKLVLVFSIIMLFSLQIKSLAVVSPTKDFYVNDYANLLSEETKEYIIRVNKELHRKTGAQIVVVTVESLEGQSIEEYATELFRKFGIGDKEKNNGLLLLLAKEERQFRIEVGYGLEGVITDGKAGNIESTYIIPYLKDDNWDEGIKNGFDACLDAIVEEYGISIERDVEGNKINYYFKCFFLGVSGIMITGGGTGIILRYIKIKIFKAFENKKIKIKKSEKIIIILLFQVIGILIILTISYGIEIISNVPYIFLCIMNILGYFIGYKIFPLVEDLLRGPTIRRR